MKRLALVLFVYAALSACREPVILVPAPGPVGGDGGDDCAHAMAAAAVCSCPWATDAGVTACRRDQAQGSASQLSPACLALAHDCTALKACPGVSGCP